MDDKVEKTTEKGFAWKVARNTLGRVVKSAVLHYKSERIPIGNEDVTCDERDPRTNKKTPVTLPKASQEKMKEIYDAGPQYQKYIQAPKGYKAPWDK